MKFKEIREISSWVVGIIGAIIIIYSWFTRPSVDLSATVECDKFVFPAGLDSALIRLQNAFSVDSLKAAVDSDLLYGLKHPREEKTRQSIIDALEPVSEYVRRRLPWRGLPDYYLEIRGYWQITLRNGQSQEVESVELFLPSAMLVQINREGKPVTVDTIHEVLQLGRMRPGEIVSLTAWTNYEPNESSVDEIRVTHKGGTGDVTVRRKVGSFGQFFDKHLREFLLVLLFATFLTIFFLYISPRLVEMANAPFQKKKSNESVKSEEEPKP